MVRLLRLHRVRALFRGRLLPRRQPRRPAAERGALVRLRLHRPAYRRMALRPSRRSLRTQERAHAVGPAHVRGFARDRRHADLRVDWVRGAGDAGRRAHHSGPQPWRRIRHQRDISQRSCRRQESRVLLEFSVRHADWRPAVRHSRAAGPAAAAHRRSAPRVGLARPVRDWRVTGGHRRWRCEAACTRPRQFVASKAVGRRQSSVRALCQYPREVS